jgi:exonuclease 3'-5' domain-containing protein 1
VLWEKYILTTLGDLDLVKMPRRHVKTIGGAELARRSGGLPQQIPRPTRKKGLKASEDFKSSWAVQSFSSNSTFWFEQNNVWIPWSIGSPIPTNDTPPSSLGDSHADSTESVATTGSVVSQSAAAGLHGSRQKPSRCVLTTTKVATPLFPGTDAGDSYIKKFAAATHFNEAISEEAVIKCELFTFRELKVVEVDKADQGGSRGILVDTQDLLVQMLDKLDAKKNWTAPDITIDCEGNRLCRYGTLSLLQLGIEPLNVVFVIDITVLGKLAFTQMGTRGQNLKEFLENKAIPKLLFDTRNDSDALFAHYKIHLRGVIDVQLMELAARTDLPKGEIMSLKNCVIRYLPLDPKVKLNWIQTKTEGSNFCKRVGWQVYDQRPLNSDLFEYAAQDVTLLPQIYRVFDTELVQKGAWWYLVKFESERRVWISHQRWWRGDQFCYSKLAGPDYWIDTDEYASSWYGY